MAEAEKSEAAEAAKEVVKDFVQTLGLLDIIQGGLALYWVRLRLAERRAPLFPSTGYEILDIALLICAAAVLGKALSLAVAFLTAVFRWLLHRLDILGVRSRLEDHLDIAVARSPCRAIAPQDYRQRPRRFEPEELATALVTEDAAAKQVIERLQTRVLFSYSLALLLILYAAHFSRPEILPLAHGLRAGVALFFLLGVLHQLDLTRTLGTFLIVQIPPLTVGAQASTAGAPEANSHANPH